MGLPAVFAVFGICQASRRSSLLADPHIATLFCYLGLMQFASSTQILIQSSSEVLPTDLNLAHPVRADMILLRNALSLAGITSARDATQLEVRN
jgi:hypothetical protein